MSQWLATRCPPVLLEFGKGFQFPFLEFLMNKVLFAIVSLAAFAAVGTMVYNNQGKKDVGSQQASGETAEKKSCCEGGCCSATTETVAHAEKSCCSEGSSCCAEKTEGTCCKGEDSACASECSEKKECCSEKTECCSDKKECSEGQCPATSEVSAKECSACTKAGADCKEECNSCTKGDQEQKTDDGN
jgi:hypothetical protein